MFGNRAQRDHRQEGESAHQQDGDNQQGDKQRAVHRKIAVTGLLAWPTSQATGDNQHRQDVAKAAEQHGHANGDALPVIARREASEGRAIVASAGGVGVDEPGQTVGAAVTDDSGRVRQQQGDPAQHQHPTGITSMVATTHFISVIPSRLPR